MIKHKLLSLFVALLATTALLASNVITYEASSQLSGYNASLNVGKTTFGSTITSHTFSNGTGTITCNGEITKIGDYAFFCCSDLTSVTISNSVKTIGKSAFHYCTGLTSVEIPNSVTSIGRNAFYMVNNIVYSGSAQWEDSYGIIKEDLYWGAKCMNGYVDGYLVYSDATKTKLCGCSTASIGDITIPNSVKEIGGSAFYYWTGLTSVTIPNSVTTIGSSAFSMCSGLTSVTIPNSVTTIGGSAFYYCTGLTSVTIGNSVTTIGRNAFDGCSGLTSVTIPNSVTSVGNRAFLDCSGLNRIICNTKSIGDSAFYNCGRIQSVTILYSTRIGNRAFDYDVSFKYEYEEYSSVDSVFVIVYPFNTISASDLKTKFSSYFDNYHYATKERWCDTQFFVLPNATTFEARPTTITINTDFSDLALSSDELFLTMLDSDKEYALDTIATQVLVSGLQPNTTYTFQFSSMIDSQRQEGCTFSVTTPALTLTTLTPKVVSAGTAIVAAETNISDYETNVGFEWRKENAPTGSASKSGAAIICNGIMEGRLLNLGTDWWRVRPYYEAADGTRYYGEWEYIDPTDASYFEPTVHTYALVTDPTVNKVQMRGYVMTGTDDVTEQGFEYWFKGAKVPRRMASATPDSVYRVQASGQVMTAVLEDLAYSTTYTCRAYAVAGGKTYYGEEVQFLTPEDPRPIYTLYVMAGENGSVNTDVSGQYREGETVTLTATAEQGFRFVQWSDGNTDNPRQLTMTANTELVAIFELADGLEQLTIDNAQCTVKKMIIDNQLFIFRGDKIYNAAGVLRK